MHTAALMDLTIGWAGLWKVLWVGLIAGVGLVALFAVGVRILAARPPGPGAVPPRQPAHHKAPVDVGTAGTMASVRGLPPGRATVAQAHPTRHAVVIAATCFAICAGIAMYGVVVLIQK